MTHNRLTSCHSDPAKLQSEPRTGEQRRYAAFEQWLSRQLSELETRWADFRVPARGRDPGFQLPR